MSENPKPSKGRTGRAAVRVIGLVAILVAVAALARLGNETPPPAVARLDSAAQNELSESTIIPRRLAVGPSNNGSGAFDGAALRLSPDGETIAFLRGPRFRRDVWIAPREHPEDASPLGLTNEQGVLSFEWALNGTHILFRRPFDLSAQFYAVRVDGGEAYALNPMAQSAVGAITLSPAHPDNALVRIGPSPGIDLDLYLLNVPEGTLELVETRGTVTEYYPDRNLQVRAGRTLDPSGLSVFARRDAGWEEVASVPRAPGEASGLLFVGGTPNNIYLLDQINEGPIGLAELDLATGERHDIAIPATGNVTHVLRDPVTWEVFAYAVEAGRIQWIALNSDFDTAIEQLNGLPGDGAIVVSQSLDNRFWIIESEGGSFLLDRTHDTLTHITS
jgi:hypothetical protein